MASSWHDWPGGENPAGRNEVTVRHRDGGERAAIRADKLAWNHDARDRDNDVVAWRYAKVF